MPSAGGASRSGGSAASPSSPNSYPTPSDQTSGSTSGNNARPQITANTQGIVGLANYKLSTPGDVTQGSVVSSEKGNVKLESGTLMLLRVSQ